eukprot:CAMPEP_0169140764 /NCGR_PEP_ID=MMETSP1015-20121227/43819_1 /TAXON_ID=342587 /ORGANISM="Karlodinium micrum, Strain CCMP2283" /LENGTH=179 /DNA_ID=CAMNT_0009206843 /DNA_START=18 /DNA_END=557 /DNA_ORIENTATION=+
MGGVFGSILGRLFGNVERKILMLGLDAAGKTTILYKLNLGEVVHTNPTIGFNVENVQYRNISFTVWDVGGQSKIRQLWRHYYQHAQGLIFVIDANDPDRIDEARAELTGMLDEEELKDTVVLVLANKQDMPTSMKAPEIEERLRLKEIKQKFKVEEACALDGQGLSDGLDWLSWNMMRS